MDIFTDVGKFYTLGAMGATALKKNRAKFKNQHKMSLTSKEQKKEEEEEEEEKEEKKKKKELLNCEKDVILKIGKR